jgi:hypothetical protein
MIRLGRWMLFLSISGLFFLLVTILLFGYNDKANKLRRLSLAKDYFTSENLLTINGTVPVTSCPLG